MKKVSFTEMKNGTKEDYLFLDKHEKNFADKTAERILEFMSNLTDTLEGYQVSRLEHSLQCATRAYKNSDEICKYIGAKTLKYLSIDGLYKAMGVKSRNKDYPQLTDHYFTGDYPVKPVDELGDSKITQLSLLSTASNN